MEIGIKRAKNSLSKLVAAARSGEKVYLMNRGERVAEIVPSREAQVENRGYGMFKNKIRLPKGWASQANRDQASEALLAEIEKSE